MTGQKSPAVTAAERRVVLKDGFRISRSLCSLSRHFMIQASVMVSIIDCRTTTPAMIMHASA